MWDQNLENMRSIIVVSLLLSSKIYEYGYEWGVETSSDEICDGHQAHAKLLIYPFGTGIIGVGVGGGGGGD